MDKKTIIYNTLSEAPMFHGCDDEFMSKLKESSVLVTYDKGSIVFIHGESSSRFYIVQKGSVKLFKESPDGSQAVTSIANIGDAFGYNAVFHDRAYQHSAEAMDDVSVVSIAISVIEQEIDGNHEFTKSLLSQLADNNVKQDKKMEHLLLQSATQKIGCFILGIADGNVDKSGVINLPYDKIHIASQLGMKSETFSRALKKLKTDTGIEVKGSVVIISDIDRLSNYSCSACSFAFPCSNN